ncbi:sulfurase [Oceanicola sp. 22II-s10i]|uniref:MOSC domain-containing protein n=1 Tax=Oceanicola sp. 22II-s10i TaxID=1317116 RepID=UPI000B528021|nr:MOSC domain-containing protein [Oceanicola sp. 22II-s10i]OWU85470.1 sulfurase [Oceanicola sp. 22II-s10i]
MPALKKTDYTAEIVWLGTVADRDAALASAPLQSLDLSFAGPANEAHGGETRPSCSRVLGLYPRDTPIRNVRQLSILSEEELQAIAGKMGLDRIDPAWLGMTMLVRGIPDFTHLPPSSRLQGPGGCTLTVDMENRPCQLPARVIEDHRPGFGKAFKQAAEGRRGVTAWVEREGRLTVGDTLRLFIPDQPAWSDIGLARGMAV